MQLNDPATLNAALLWSLFVGIPTLAIAAKVGALGALVRWATSPKGAS